MIFFIVKMNFSLHLTEIYQNDHKDEKFYFNSHIAVPLKR